MWKWFIQKSRPRLSGKVAALAVGRGKCEQKRKNGFYRTVLNNCLSFLNEVKNLAKNTGVKYTLSIILCRILR